MAVGVGAILIVAVPLQSMANHLQGSVQLVGTAPHPTHAQPHDELEGQRQIGTEWERD